MKVLNLIWGFSLGGVRECFLTYSKLGDFDSRLVVHSLCINLGSTDADFSVLQANKIDVVNIKHRLDFSWLSQCAAVINRESPDLIFTHGFNGPVVVDILRRKYKLTIPMVCSYHSEYQPPTWSRKWLVPIFNGAMHWLYRKRALGIVTVSEFAKQTLVDYGVPDKKVTVVLSGIKDRAQAQRSLQSLMPSWQGPQDAIILGVASRLDAIKGLPFLLQALVLIRKRCRVHLVIVGEGPEKQELEGKAVSLGLCDHVSFVGYQKNVAEWMDAFDVFCVPSLSETLCLSLIEALRAETASVASTVGGIVEVVRDQKEALLVPPEDVRALADAILRLSEDSVLRKALGINARKRFESEFTEKRMKRQLVDWLLSCGGILSDLKVDSK